MSQKNVFISGASRGIGAATAEVFAKNGYNLSLNCKNSIDKLENLKDKLIKEYNVDVLIFKADSGNFDEMEMVFEESFKHFKKIDVLINNAGISHIGLLQDMSPKEWNNVISSNLNSVFNCTKLVLPSMIRRQSGSIVNVSSVWGIYGASCEVAYSASKGGMNAFTKALAKEVAPSNIKVNAAALGVIDTEMNSCFSAEEREAIKDEIALGRFATALEAGEFLFDLAIRNPYLTGQIITFDGGYC
ncbi:3-oxoacyl-[acyl-carrier protein] reductase [Acetitomaculum ruminis DSM 5522]|uniref:3-oxoacyl-[acyl-carrier protein] reductase n=1 Tax=Acetitomaculum ruminis DSM 5522 TaxID=1120918 RepID=A0A1I0W3J2_9FIRM|nr:SDR family NAD(P)-dependent oxidoreductase [Acetitomaculum ruminis]SFA83315.1 3-oxoacyl-[acyl-carrier protein] reductase [Acetitomaculum ruminis DSM 5522]